MAKLLRGLLLVLLCQPAWGATMPDVTGLDRPAAEERLKAAGLQGWKVLFTPDPRENQVVRQLPPPGTQVVATPVIYVAPPSQAAPARNKRSVPRLLLLLLLQLALVGAGVRAFLQLRSTRRGASLLEALIALALLGFVLAVFILLFHQSFRMGTRAQRASIATRLAENTLDEMRDWARSPANWEVGFGAFTAGPLLDPQFPDYPIEVQVLDTPIYSPCSAFEAGHPQGPRELASSVVTAQVEVSWGGAPHERVRLVSHLGEPARPLAGIGVSVIRESGPADPVPPDGEVVYRADLTDGADPVPDVMFQWFLEPLSSATTPPGNATLRLASRDGVQAGVQNRYLWNPNLPVTDPGRWRTVAGLVGVVARARYHGRAVPPEGATPPAVVEMGD